MKYALSSALAALLLATSATNAAAQVATTTPPTTSAPREASVAPGSATPSLRTERNSPTLFFTGIGLTAIGLGGLAGGYAGNVLGRRQCDRDAVSAAGPLPIAAGAAAYQVVYSHCVNESGAVIGGTAAMIAGGAFTAIGALFIVAGAWRVTVPAQTTSRMVPNVDVGVGSLRLDWTF